MGAPRLLDPFDTRKNTKFGSPPDKSMRRMSDTSGDQVAIAEAGGIAPLVALAASGTEEQKEFAAWALGILAFFDTNHVAIAAAGGIAPLVALAASGTEKQKEYAARALARLASNATNKVAIAAAGGIAPLVALAASGTEKQKEYAALALVHFPDSRSGRGAATGIIAVDAPRFKLNERVECRDDGKKWWAGTVVSVDPLLVQPTGAAWTKGFTWGEVRFPNQGGDPMLPSLPSSTATKDAPVVLNMQASDTFRGHEAEASALQLQTELERERQSARQAIERERQSAREAIERERQSAREAREASLGRRLMALEAQISRTTELIHQVGLPLIASDDISKASDGL